MIRCELGSFAAEFGRRLHPFVEAFGPVLRSLAAVAGEPLGAEIRPAVRALERETRDLLAGVAARRAHVVVFGPLKSGKSTLIDALAGEYVTKVSTLPGYPCVVRIGHGAEWSALTVRHDGSQERPENPEATRILLQRAQSELAERVHAAGAAPGTLDPADDHPRAIRRLELELPAAALAGSALTLVEVPGRRGLVDVPPERALVGLAGEVACGVLVLPTDHPEPARAFEGVGALLGRFRRLLVVLNLDGQGRNLGPDGSLVRALDQEEADRVVLAFREQALGPDLRRAEDAGRLSIHAIDLLAEASRRLRAAAASSPDTPDIGDEEEEPGGGPLEELALDVARLLNEDEHAVEFVGDALRRGGILAERALAECRRPDIDALARHVPALEREREGTVARLAALRRASRAGAERLSWEEALEPLRADLEAYGETRARAATAEAVERVQGTLDRWFASDASLASLVKDGLTPLSRRPWGRIAEGLRTRLGQLAAAGIRAPEEPARDLERAGVDLGSSAVRAARSAGAVRREERVPAPLAWEDVPVRRGPVATLLLRSRRSLLEKTFGPEEAPERRTPASEKRARLPAPARRSLSRTIEEAIRANAVELARRESHRLFRAFVQGLCRDLAARATEGERGLARPLEELEREIQTLGDLRNDLATLRGAAEGAERELASLSHGYGWLEEDLPIRTVEPSERAGNDAATPVPATPPRFD